MKHRKIILDEIDDEKVFNSLRRLGVTLEDSDSSEGLEITVEDGSTIILPENFNIFDDLSYIEEGNNSAKSVRMIICVNMESLNEYKSMNEYKKKVHREESKSMNISNDVESIIDCDAA